MSIHIRLKDGSFAEQFVMLDEPLLDELRRLDSFPALAEVAESDPYADTLLDESKLRAISQEINAVLTELAPQVEKHGTRESWQSRARLKVDLEKFAAMISRLMPSESIWVIGD